MKITKLSSIIFKIIVTLLILAVAYVSALYIIIFLGMMLHLNGVIVFFTLLIIPQLVIIVWNKKKRKSLFISWLIYILIVAIAGGINYGIVAYEESLIVKTDLNINIYEYLPFDDESKIAVLDDEASLKLDDNLPILDGAAAVFPLYSAFVNAVYPSWVKYGEEPFVYHNTVRGYEVLAEKETDIFFGAYPSEEQIKYAKEQGTEFEYTPIGKEGFVFFVNKDNPIESLTSEQIRGIYSGAITNWKEVGGNDEEIIAFQRNEGSGSQSMLIRFMNGVEIMEPRTEEVNDLMSGIIEQVANYKNYDNSIGFSFRYYLDTLIANPDVKMIAIDGVEATAENISNGTYPITTDLYAVTYKDNANKNVIRLLEWIQSDEGQELVEKTGYSRVK